MNFDSMHYPFPSRRYVVYSKKGIVATSQYLAAEAGLDAMKRGGNAVDAAVAAAACLTVTEPCSNGIGGDAFAIVWSGGKLHGLNSSGPAPAALTAEHVRGLGHNTMPRFGWEPVTVPGIPAAWAALNGRFGRLRLSELMESAARHAEEGYPVSPVVADAWRRAAAVYMKAEPKALFRHWFDTFTKEGRAPEAGELFRLPGHAATLREIGRTAGRAFYEGDLAERIAAFAAETGGYITKGDLAAFRPQWVEPLGVKFRGHDIWELPPNGHGIVALMALNILEGFDPAPMEDCTALHRQVEAIKLAFADGLKYIADPTAMRVGAGELLSADYAAKRRELIGEMAAVPQPGAFDDHGTVYLAAADGEGNMVSYIQSNYMGFGSGLVVPGAGIALHDRGANFSLNPDHMNCLAPCKRPYHTIIPGFITRDGKPLGPFGVMGGFMQPQGHVQAVTHLLEHGLNPQAALDCPRWRWDSGLGVSVEEGIDAGLAGELERRGHALTWEASGGGFGRGQIILLDDSGVLAAGTDQRGDSAAYAW